MTTKHPIPPDVRRFVLTSIPSVPHIEALMLVRGNAPARWSAQLLAERLYVSPARAADVLDELRQSGLLEHDAASGLYAYDTQPSERSRIVEQLAIFYASHLVEITILIHSQLDRQAQHFADAFTFRKDRKDV